MHGKVLYVGKGEKPQESYKLLPKSSALDVTKAAMMKGG
jgi:hypothetical protein